MPKQHAEKGIIQRNLRTAQKYEARIRSQFDQEGRKWKQRVNEGLAQIDGVFARAFALPQLAPQLAAINGIQLSERDLQQVAYQMSVISENGTPNNSAGGSRKERRVQASQNRKAERMSPQARRFLYLLLMLIFLVSCTNIGQVGPTDTEQPAPTAIVEAQPSPAPPPPTSEAVDPDAIDEDLEDEVSEDIDEEETVEAPGDTPEIDLTRIPDNELRAAAAQAGVLLTPEAITQFQVTRESGGARKVMYRLVGSGEEATVEIARSNEDGNITYEVVATPEAGSIVEDEENDGVLLVMASTDSTLLFTIDTNAEGESEVTATETPVAEPAPTPVENPTPEGTPEFVPNMAFAEEWMENEIVYFPCTEDEIQACSVQAVFEEFVEYGTYNSPNSGAIPIPNTDWVIELGASVWTKDNNGNPVNYVVPLSMANTQTEERIIGPTWQETPLPLWQMFDLKIKIPQIFLTLFGNNSSFTYTGDSRDYLNEGDIGMPRLDPGDRMYINFPFGNKDVLGEYLPQQVYDALKPALDAYYGEDRTALTTFTSTGDIAAYSETLGDNAIFDSEGRPILFNGAGASMFEDIVHNGELSTD